MFLIIKFLKLLSYTYNFNTYKNVFVIFRLIFKKKLQINSTNKFYLKYQKIEHFVYGVNKYIFLNNSIKY